MHQLQAGSPDTANNRWLKFEHSDQSEAQLVKIKISLRLMNNLQSFKEKTLINIDFSSSDS